MQPEKNTIRGITLVPQPAAQYLTDKQIIDYRAHRRELVKWCLSKGKKPRKGVGYAEDTVRVRAGHIDRFYRWCWDEHERYTTAIDHADSDEYMDYLAFNSDMQRSSKSKYQKAIKMLWKWRSNVYGEDEWDPDITFSEPSQSQPREYFTKDERRRVREAALDMGSIPHYKSVSGAEREEWKKYIAIVTEKPVDAIGKDDWDELTGWKETSLVHVSLDAGLRPVEVRNARVSWFDSSNDVLRIPKADSAKNRDNWIVALRSDTSDVLSRWLAERSNYDAYTDTDAVWLTRRGNEYSSTTLKRLLHRVCDRAGIDTSTRNITWYAIRHSVGTYLTREEGLAAAKAQLRHKSARTTVKYDQVPIEDRQSALDRMG